MQTPLKKRLGDSYFTLDNALKNNQFYLQKCIARKSILKNGESMV